MHNRTYHQKVEWSGMGWIDSVFSMESHAIHMTLSEKCTGIIAVIFCRETSFFSEVLTARNLARHNPIEVQFSQQLQHSCRRFFRFESSLSAFNLVVLQPCSGGTDTCPLLCIPIQFYRIDIREDANTHKVISYKYLPNSICTVVEEWHHGYFCLGYFFSSTHFDLVTLTRRVERLSVLVNR